MGESTEDVRPVGPKYELVSCVGSEEGRGRGGNGGADEPTRDPGEKKRPTWLRPADGVGVSTKPRRLR